MTYKMTPEYQKVLTEMIGECWHENTIHIASGYRCLECGEVFLFKERIEKCNRRSFQTDSDMMKVFRWLVDNGKWLTFKNYTAQRIFISDSPIIFESATFDDHIYSWLFYDAERFNCLVAQCKMEGGV